MRHGRLYDSLRSFSCSSLCLCILITHKPLKQRFRHRQWNHSTENISLFVLFPSKIRWMFSPEHLGFISERYFYIYLWTIVCFYLFILLSHLRFGAETNCCCASNKQQQQNTPLFLIFTTCQTLWQRALEENSWAIPTKIWPRRWVTLIRITNMLKFETYLIVLPQISVKLYLIRRTHARQNWANASLKDWKVRDCEAAVWEH